MLTDIHNYFCPGNTVYLNSSAFFKWDSMSYLCVVNLFPYGDGDECSHYKEIGEM